MAHYLSALLILGCALANAQGAEEDFVILTIDGKLIGPIDPIGDRIENGQQATRLITSYHQLLTATVQLEVAILHEQILEFIPRFEVAYTAADSAEFSHLMDEIDLRLAAIQYIHTQKYSQEVRTLLTEAYRLILPRFGDERQLKP